MVVDDNCTNQDANNLGLANTLNICVPIHDQFLMLLLHFFYRVLNWVNRINSLKMAKFKIGKKVLVKRAILRAVTNIKASLCRFVLKLSIQHENSTCGLLMRYYFKAVADNSSNISLDSVF